MRSALLAAAVLVPLAVIAASATFTLTSSDSTGSPAQIYVGKSNCGSKTLHFNWDVSTGHPTVGEQVLVVRAVNSSDCGNASPPSPDKVEDVTFQGEIGSEAVAAKDMILDQSDAGLLGGCDNTDRSSGNPYTTFYCVQLKSSTTFSGTQVVSQNLPVNFATKPPTPPTAVSAQGGDQHLRLSWSAGDASENISSYDVHVLGPGDTLDTSKYADRVNQQTNSDESKTDQGVSLRNDVPYQVQIIATDVYGNVSAASQPVTGTPEAVLDFYKLYRSEGGGATGGGGCSTGGAGFWVFGGLGAALLWRRKKAGAVLLAVVLLAPAARAEDRPPRRVLVGLKIDRYDPKVDSERGLTGSPYHQIFGSRAPLRWQLEVDWEVWHPFGSVLVGVTAGFWQNYGKGLVAGADGNPIQPLTRSADTALLDIVPFGVIATYRFDWLADRWPRFPFIPYAQAGLMSALWASKTGTGSVSKDTTRGGRGSGWTYGYTTALGFALDLGTIDPDLARETYVDTGIQRSSLFAEYGWTRLDDFHKSGALILSDRAWRFGLSLEF